MRPTQPYIEEKFDYYNNLCFGGQLPRPRLMLSQRNRAVGMTKSRVTFVNGKPVVSHTIEISVRYDLPEIEYIDTIVHEMIHYYIRINNIQDDSPHGTVFRSMMNDISQKYGIRITIEYDESDEELIARVTDRNRYICVVEAVDGSTSFAIVIRDKVFHCWDVISKHPNVKDFKWYVSNRAIFEQFPTRITPAFITIEPDKIQDYLFGAHELERIDNVIKPKEQ